MITIVDYGMGNLGSIVNMLGRIDVPSQVSSDIEIIRNADKIILPGVGGFDQAMNNIRSRNLEDVLIEKAAQKTPLLGICLGMQILMETSEEGSARGLGLIKGTVKKFQFPEDQQHLKVPHMGWNNVTPVKPHPLFDHYTDEIRFYFVHGYYVTPEQDEHIICTTNYGTQFCSSVGREHIMGVQFHPEKSHAFGMQLFKNFAAL
jgi:glutamine amidotransferase